MLAEVERVWDVHTHVIPPIVGDWAAKGEWGLSLADGKLVNGYSATPLGRLGRPDLLIEWIESQSLAGAVVSVPPPVFQIDASDIDRQYEWAYALNDALAQACAVDTNRLRPLALLPLLDAEKSAELVNSHQFGPQGFAGIVIGTDSGQLALSAPELEPVWRALTDPHIPIFIHPSTCPDPRLSDFYLANLLGNPVETAIAVAHLIFGGVMERFSPTVVLAHGGGVSSALIGRWQQGFDTKRPGIPELQESPAQSLRKFFVDGLVYDEETLEFTIAQFGPDQLLLGSDWPFPIAASSSEAALPGIGQDEMTRVAANTVRAFPSLVSEIPE